MNHSKPSHTTHPSFIAEKNEFHIFRRSQRYISVGVVGIRDYFKEFFIGTKDDCESPLFDFLAMKSAQ